MKETSPGPTGTAGERIETDALGSRRIDNSNYYGIQTVRAHENFAISGKTIADIPGFIESIIQIKQAAALANLAVVGFPRRSLRRSSRPATIGWTISRLRSFASTSIMAAAARPRT
ncbi:hypothetical protein AJ88_11765 [Mesorhizobium amorphae CCBAU 01583]|nr:hypothetical protein AJ88_11765 [Mesorhizobium amorphae CCBAU 01583]